MSANRFLAIVVLVTMWPVWAIANPPTDQPAEESTWYLVEVTANSVYVRSGPSANYYPVTKLDAGARVVVVGDDGDWRAIQPPDGCYSLIAEIYVDVGDDAHGVVNGDNVRIRAGSHLEPDKHYATQLKLSRGAEVEILGHVEKVGSEEWGYYKIVPPPGAKLWMSAEYLARVPQELLALEAAAKADPAIGQAAPTAGETQSADEGAEPVSEGRAISHETESTAVPVPSPEELKVQMAECRRQIEQLDADLKAELAKPLLRRDLARIVEGFKPLANQDVDDFARLYARTRIEQVEDLIEAIEAVARVRKLGEQVKADRQAALTARAAIRPALRPIGQGFVAEGELRLSAVYSSPVGPRRYRLVDPGSDPVRTLAYVEIPPGSGINVEEYLGRIVGVRAREIRLQTGDVDPIAIYVASDLVVLEKPDEGAPSLPGADD